MKILIVDDSPTMRAMIRRSFVTNAIDCETMEAGDGAEALALMSESPDLVLCDGELPSMTGADFVRALRDAEDDTPVLLITADPSSPSAQEATDAGVDGLLAKPFTPAQLSEQILQIAS